MTDFAPTPLIRLGNLFPNREVYAKCEFLAPSGCFKIRGANHLLDRLEREGSKRQLVVPSMGNTALGAAEAAKAFGFTMTGVVPENLSRAKDERLRALGVDLIKLPGGGSKLLQIATDIARDQGAYFVHPHLDPNWSDGYQSIAAEVLQALPDCRSLVFPVGGGGLLLGLLAYTRANPSSMRLVGCEPYSYPKYAAFDHARTTTIADGLRLETPHRQVREAIEDAQIEIGLVSEMDIRAALKDLFKTQALVVEPSSAITLAFVKNRAPDLEEPVCVILTGGNIAMEDHRRLMSEVEA